MKVFVNNEEKEVESGISVESLLAIYLDGLFVVELNGEILTRDKHNSTILKDGDIVEVFEITGGG